MKKTKVVIYARVSTLVQENKGKLAPEMFITAKGNVIPLRVGVKNLVYRIMKEEMIGYRIIEPNCPIEVMTSETEDIFILSSKLINRYASTYEKKIIEIKK